MTHECTINALKRNCDHSRKAQLLALAVCLDKTYKLLTLLPFIRTKTPFITVITPPSAESLQSLESKAPKEIRFFFRSGTCRTSVNVGRIPLYILILIIPFPTHRLYCYLSSHYNYHFLYMWQTIPIETHVIRGTRIKNSFNLGTNIIFNYIQCPIGIRLLSILRNDAYIREFIIYPFHFPLRTGFMMCLFFYNGTSIQYVSCLF